MPVDHAAPRALLLTLLACWPLGVACSSASTSTMASGTGPAGTTAPTVRVVEQCNRTVCDVASEAEPDQNACNECLEACSEAYMTCNFATDCSYACGSDTPYICTDEDRLACIDRELHVESSEPVDDALEQACERFNRLHAPCGDTHADCSKYARIWQPEMAAVYDCIAALSCGDDISKCAFPPESTFGDEVAEAGDAVCSAISRTFIHESLRTFLNQRGNWWRPGVRSAALECAKLNYCGDAIACFNAWWDFAIGGA